MTRQRQIERYAQGDGEACHAPLTETAGCENRDDLRWSESLSKKRIELNCFLDGGVSSPIGATGAPAQWLAAGGSNSGCGTSAAKRTAFRPGL